MTTRALPAPQPPVGVIESLATGFETVTGRLALILLPLALDVLLWLGPHLSVRPVVQDVLEQVAKLAVLQPSIAPAESLWRTVLTPVAHRFNLLSLLSVPALPRLGCLPGAWCLPSLMAVRSPVAVPGGVPHIVPIGNWLEMLTLIVALYLVGLFLGALYLGAIALQVRDAQLDWRAVVHHVGGWWARLVALAAVVSLAALAYMTPVTLAAVVAGQVLGQAGFVFVYLLGASAGLWVLFYLAFVVHALLLQGRGLFGAMRDSARVVQWNLPSTLVLFALIAGLSFGMGVVWSIPAEDSWLALVGIAGHAYVVTGLAAASFVYYKDRFRWSSELRDYLVARAEGLKGARTKTK